MVVVVDDGPKTVVSSVVRRVCTVGWWCRR